jgi:hypothetical protein
MSANSSVTPMAKVLAFPVQHNCPSCKQMCSPEDLSECLRCGALYCSQCSWECECDRQALEIVERAMEQKYRRTGEPIAEPCEENALALAFMREQFGEGL